MIKTIKELREPYDSIIRIQEVSSSIKYFKSLSNIDFNVYLPSRGMNLQRDLVWGLDQKRSLIESVLIGRHIPHCAIINIIDPNDKSKEIHQVIDGKQRLTTIFGFMDDEFDIIIEDKPYFYSELPIDYQRAISQFHFRYYRWDEPFDKPITDDEKINWFKFINFAGTPQDLQHMKALS